MTVTREPIRRLPFQPYALAATHWTLAEQRHLFDLNPPYQRASVWAEEQRVALIESLLRGVPIGAIIYNARGLGGDIDPMYAIIDGKQRVETIRMFVDSGFTVPAWWFDEDEVTTREGEVTYADLTDVGRRRIAMLPMPGLEANVKTIEAEAEIFHLVNTGGTAQTDADIAAARAVAGIEHTPTQPSIYIVQNETGGVEGVFRDADEATTVYQQETYTVAETTVWEPGQYLKAMLRKWDRDNA